MGLHYSTGRKDLVRGPGGPARFRAERRIDVELHPRIEAQVRAQFLLGQHEQAASAALREVGDQGARTGQRKRVDDRR
jgi:hypothetical protein